MNTSTKARVRRLEELRPVERAAWRFVELRQHPTEPGLWCDGQQWATLAEHDARQPERSISVRLYTHERRA